MKLEQAARQLLKVVEGIQHGTDWNNGTHAKIYRPKFPAAITALREALEQPDEIDWIETNKALAKEIIELKKQIEQSVSQEPVAEVKVRPLRGYESTSKVDIEWRTRPTAGFLYTAQQPVSRAELKDAFQEGFNRAADLYAPQSVSQEPYAYEVWDEQDQSFTMIYASSLEEFHWIEKENIVTILYAAPVRTKDLTDDEIDEIFAEHGMIPNTKAVRSVIAADREKNK